MKRWLSPTVDTVAGRGPVEALFRARTAESLAVLAYHGVDDPHSFGRQLDWLVGHAAPVSLEDVLEAARGQRQLPRHAVLVTFDDGFRSVLDLGLPLLVEREMPAVVFVVAGFLTSDQPFWWEEVEQLCWAGGSVPGFDGATPAALVRQLKAVPNRDRERMMAELRRTAADRLRSESIQSPRHLQLADLPRLAASGVEIGNHSLTHPCLPRCTTDEIAREVAESHEILSRAITVPIRAFAYPNGDVDERVEAAVREHGYEIGFLFDHRHAGVPTRSPLRVSRLRVSSTTPLSRFRAILNGAHPALHGLLTSWRR